MKKVAVLLIVIIILSFVSCGSSQVEPVEQETLVDEKESFDPTGIWVCSFVANGDNWGTQKGDNITWTFTLYDGGTGKYTITNSRSAMQNSEFGATWEKKDDIINISYSSVTRGFRVNYENDSLTPVDDSSKVLTRQQ